MPGRRALILILLTTASAAAAAVPPPTSLCARVDVDGAGFEAVQRVKGLEGVDWWAEVGGALLVCGDGWFLEPLEDQGRTFTIEPGVDPARVVVVRGFTGDELTALGGLRVLAATGGRALGELGEPPDIVTARFQGDRLRRIEPLPDGGVVVRQTANAPARRATAFAPVIADLVAEVDGGRWFADVQTLASYSRHTTGSEIDDARDWLAARLDALPGITVTTPSFNVGVVMAYNVVGTLTGLTRPDEYLIVGGHYDSMPAPPAAAPGADDNASGCAGVLEVARILAAHPPEATVQFICYSGEEQGLYGSEDHADWVYSQGLDVLAMLNLDMIGYNTPSSPLGCLLESDDPYLWLIDLHVDAAAQFTSLPTSTSTSPYGSDHMSYLFYGVPAILAIEDDEDFNPYYHTSMDTPDKLSVEMGEEIVTMVLAAAAHLAGGAANDIFWDGFELGNTDRWSAPPVN